jgi:hypothetical protein
MPRLPLTYRPPRESAGQRGKDRHPDAPGQPEHRRSRRQDQPPSRDWRTDGKGPAYRKISGWFVEYDPAELERFVRDEYLADRWPELDEHVAV